jgi:hypothetical protein
VLCQLVPCSAMSASNSAAINQCEADERRCVTLVPAAYRRILDYRIVPSTQIAKPPEVAG